MHHKTFTNYYQFHKLIAIPLKFNKTISRYDLPTLHIIIHNNKAKNDAQLDYDEVGHMNKGAFEIHPPKNKLHNEIERQRASYNGKASSRPSPARRVGGV